ncbi:transposase [Arenimonas composti]|uniref:Transposase IS200-like domain-containing protein n=1 Tax=Arenimonas composti TR7-09 = DSM 18010 TaxID=1121013 RepID=A0A091C0J6_9GAMM|nr:transposase [Arenimonas composti]KFN50155.1 hypothetical protein P873_07920 [Arenimonas composti TR7-09 = DSM 18010]
MPRRPRITHPDLTQHIVQRGNNRGLCFFADEDRRTYLGALREAAMRNVCLVHAFVLMSNHVHLLVTPGEEGAVAATMQSLGRKFVRHVNDTHGRSGTLWEGRYHSTPVYGLGHTLACYRYIEENPVRARMVGTAGEWPWSSHIANATGLPDGLLTPHAAFLGLGDEDRRRGENYARLFDRPLPAHVVDEIRFCLRRREPFGKPPANDRLTEESDPSC